MWWWSGLAVSAAVAFGSEGYRSPLLLYIGASVAAVASRKLLMGPAKRPPSGRFRTGRRDAVQSRMFLLSLTEPLLGIPFSPSNGMVPNGAFAAHERLEVGRARELGKSYSKIPIGKQNHSKFRLEPMTSISL